MGPEESQTGLPQNELSHDDGGGPRLGRRIPCCNLSRKSLQCCLITIAHGHWLGVQASQQRTVLRQELDVTAFRTFQNYIAAGGAVRKKCKPREDVTIQFVVAAEALHSSNAGRRLFLRLGRRNGAVFFFSGHFFNTHCVYLLETLPQTMPSRQHIASCCCTSRDCLS